MSRGIDWVRPHRDDSGNLVRWLDGIVCPPGTPAGPDPDRAEMLPAEGLANELMVGSMPASALGYAASATPDWVGLSFSDAMAGAADVLDDRCAGETCALVHTADFKLHSYLAGAALAMALTEKD